MNYLLQLGHRRVALLAAAPEVATARDVRRTWEDKLRSAGSEATESWVADGRFTEQGGAEAAEQILDRHPDVTAIFAANDKMAVGAIHQLGRRGIRVPQDISVVGFDDLQHSAFVNPSLTTVHLPLYQVGAMACERLIERIHGRREPVAEILATHLVMRESAGLVRNTPNRVSPRR
jgi:LacI family transcriptional regulator